MSAKAKLQKKRGTGAALSIESLIYAQNQHTIQIITV
jgi:hypothetical protein